MAARMTPQEVHAFLDAKPGWIILSTVGRNGYPHSVPLGYFRVGDDVYLGCRANTQKTKNIERNPQVSLVLETSNWGLEVGNLLPLRFALPLFDRLGHGLSIGLTRSWPTPHAKRSM